MSEMIRSRFVICGSDLRIKKAFYRQERGGILDWWVPHQVSGSEVETVNARSQHLLFLAPLYFNINIPRYSSSITPMTFTIQLENQLAPCDSKI